MSAQAGPSYGAGAAAGDEEFEEGEDEEEEPPPFPEPEPRTMQLADLLGLAAEVEAAALVQEGASVGVLAMPQPGLCP
jgi:hypothetical protein